MRISARLPADDGMLVVKALEAVADDLAPPPAAGSRSDGEPAGDPADDPVFGVGDRPVASKRWATPEPAQVRMADALRVLAETTLASGPAERTGDQRYQVVVVVRHDPRPTAPHPTGPHPAPHPGRGDAPLPLPGEPLPPPEPPASIPGGPALPQPTVERIACDASVVALVEDALGQPLGVGRQTRIVPHRLRRALTRRDRGCRFPGCATTRHLDAHHVRHWAHGGPTDPDNLLLICRFHHTLLHEGNFTIHTHAPGRFTFHRPDHTLIQTTAPTPAADPHRLTTDNLTHGIAPTPDSLIPDWDGTPQDIDAAVAVLADHTFSTSELHPGNASAEAPHSARSRHPMMQGSPVAEPG